MQFKFPMQLFFAVVFVLNLVACGSVDVGPSKSGGEQDASAVSALVVSRAQQRWNALLKQDLNVAYGFISPGGRSLMTVEQYRPRVNTGFWRGAKVDKAVCAAETCEVTVLVEMTIEGVKSSIPVKETWILDAGKWWFVYQG